MQSKNTYLAIVGIVLLVIGLFAWAIRLELVTWIAVILALIGILCWHMSP